MSCHCPRERDFIKTKVWGLLGGAKPKAKITNANHRQANAKRFKTTATGPRQIWNHSITIKSTTDYKVPSRDKEQGQNLNSFF